MPASQSDPPLRHEQAVEATAWFAAMMARVSSRDIAGAREAQAELAKHGVRVEVPSMDEGGRRAS